MEQKYNWRQIKQAVKDAYKVEATEDSWGVKCFYEHYFLKVLLEQLKKIKQFIK